MVYSNRHCLSVFLFSSTVWNSLVGDHLLEKLSAGVVILDAVLSVCVPFPFDILDIMWHSFVLLPGRCCFIYMSFVRFLRFYDVVRRISRHIRCFK